MELTTRYDSPLGRILLAADGEGLTGLWFEGGKYFAAGLGPDSREGDTPALEAAKRWLDTYFSGGVPDFLPALHLRGTPFQLDVWALLLGIPYGKTTSYGELARKLSARRGLRRMSAQAIGGAVGRNPVSIIVPCHRVVGAGGGLTGYAGGIEKKAALLRLEGADMEGPERFCRRL